MNFTLTIEAGASVFKALEMLADLKLANSAVQSFSVGGSGRVYTNVVADPPVTESPSIKVDNLPGFVTETVTEEPEAKKGPVPKKPAKPKKGGDTVEGAKVDKPAAGTVTLDSLTEAAKAFYAKHGKPKTLEVLAKYGVQNVKDMPADKYADLAVDLALE